MNKVQSSKSPGPRFPEEEDKESEAFELGLSRFLLFLFCVVLDSLLIHLHHYSFFERFHNYLAAARGIKPALLFYLAPAAEALSLLITARLALAFIPPARRRRRFLSAVLGLPVLYGGMLLLEFGFMRFLENLSRADELWFHGMVFGLCGLGAAACISFFVALARTDGSGKVFRLLFPLFIRTFPLALVLGGLVFSGRKVSVVFMALPFGGAVLRAGFNLFLFLWLIRVLCRMVRGNWEQSLPVAPPLTVAMFSGLLTVVLSGLCIVVPGNPHHLDAFSPPSMVFHKLKIPPARVEPRGDKWLVSSRSLSLVVGSHPFDLALLDRNKRPLLRLQQGRDKSPAYRGVAISRELFSFRTFPLLGPARPVMMRMLLSSHPVEEAEVSISSGEVVAEAKAGSRPVEISLSFFSEDIVKITVDAGPRALTKTVSVSFVCGDDEKFYGLGAGEEGAPLARGDYEMSLAGASPEQGPFNRGFKVFSSKPVSLSLGSGSPWPVPFVLFSRGVGIFMAESVAARMELGDKYPDTVRFSGRGGPLTLYIITGASSEEVVKKFSAITGTRGKLSALTLLPWMEDSSARTLGVTAERAGISPGPQDKNSFLSLLRQSGLVPGFRLVRRNREEEREPGQERKALQIPESPEEAGSKVIMEDLPLLRPWREAIEKEEARKGLFVKNRVGLPLCILLRSGSFAMLDLTNPETAELLSARWSALSREPVSGLLLSDDCQLPPEGSLYSGDPGYVSRNLYPLLYARLARERLGDDAILVSPAGFAGMSRYVNAALFPENPERAEPGKSLSRMLNLELSGGPLAGVSFRLFQEEGEGRHKEEAAFLAAFSPLLIINPRDMEQGRNQAAGGEMLARVLRVRVRLFPFFYSLAKREAEAGEPMFLPAGVFRGDGSASFGLKVRGGLLALSGVGEEVVFPRGTWLHLQSLSVAGPGRGVIPEDSGLALFLGEGALIPVFEREGEPSRSRGEGIDELLSRDITFLWRWGKRARFRLFDGAEAMARAAGESVFLTVRGGGKRSYSWTVYECPAPLAVFRDGIRLPESEWEYRERVKMLTVSGGKGPHAHQVEVVLRGE